MSEERKPGDFIMMQSLNSDKKIGAAYGGSVVRITRSVFGDLSYVGMLGPDEARTLAADLIHFAEEAEKDG